MDVGIPVTFMGKPLRVYDSYGDLVTEQKSALESIDEMSAKSLSLVEEIFNKTDFMNRQITFPGGRTILGSEVFDHISAFNYFQNSTVLGGATAAYTPQDLKLNAHHFGRNTEISVDGKSVLIGKSERVSIPGKRGFTVSSVELPVETKAQTTIHEIIHAAAHKSGAMPDNFSDQIMGLQSGGGTIDSAMLVGANEAFAESLSHQLVREAGITENIVASGYDTIGEQLISNKKTPLKTPIKSSTTGIQKVFGGSKEEAESFLNIRDAFAGQYMRRPVSTPAEALAISKEPIYQAMSSGYVSHRGTEFISPLDSIGAEVSHGFKTIANQAAERGVEAGRFVHGIVTSTGGTKTSTKIIQGMEQAKRITGGSRNLGVGVGVGVAIAGAGYMHHRKKDKG
jgi:hypothetical protein